MRRCSAIVLLLLAGLAGGCGSTPRPPLPKGELVRLARGGRAPFDDARIVVRPDHQAIVSDRVGSKVVDLGPDSFELLRRDLDAAGVSKLHPAESSIPGPDAYRYALAYRGRTIRFAESETPTDLRNVILRLSHFLDSVPRDARAPFVRIKRKGGYASRPVSVYADYDGQVQRFEGSGAHERRFRLPAGRLQRLERAVERVALGEAPSTKVPTSADGFEYEVTAGSRTVRQRMAISPLIQSVLSLSGASP